MAEKRRLPVLNSSPQEPPPEERPAWHWAGFGVVIILAAWLPLAYVAEFLKGRAIRAFLGPVESEDQATLAIAALSSGDRARLTSVLVGLSALALAAGSLAGGYVVGRWSDKAGWRESAAAGAAVGALTGLLAFASGGSPTAFLPAILTVVMAALGGSWGARRKTP
ncbi:hypothetical protein LZC95_53455 [Pendulispora brunnea]|uniref:ABC transporter permease n=1 Tax=Pendulispora brunnea TaxID=2905690 RepID=A0ABZ2K993_9BACT